MTFACGLSGSGITGANFITNSSAVSLGSLDATSPSANEVNSVVDASNPVRSVNGNAAPYQALVTATISGIEWAPGQTFFVRWQDSDTGGLDSGHGIDDFSLTASAVPEPSTWALFGLGVAGFGLFRSRRCFVIR